MKSAVSLQVDTDVLLKLVTHLRRLGGTQDLNEAMTTAIASWLAAQSALPGAADPANVRGYQWKSLFLPEGTVLRSWSYGAHNYAVVEGDEIMHEGRAVSPNQFAQLFARSTRNAWTDLFVRRPGDKQFKLACRLREELAQESYSAPPSAPAQPDAASHLLAALLANVSSSATPAAPAAAVEPAPTRCCEAAPGWTLPERRKYRYRIEDVAFD
jgi:hypothetical protein